MGQKVNPIGFRILNKKSWQSVWFDKKNYGPNLINDINIRKFIIKHYDNAHISNVIIERAANKIIAVIKTSRPGQIIGKGGLGIEEIKKKIKNQLGQDVDIKIMEISKPDTNAQLIGKNIAKQLESRSAFKKAMKKAIKNAIKHGAKGIKISCSGRLSGVEIARTEWYKEGSIPLHTFRSNIDYATASAYTTYGVIGIKVWVFHGMINSNSQNK